MSGVSQPRSMVPRLLPRPIAFATWIALAASVPATAQSAAAPGGEIRGRVVDAASQTPVSIATVEVSDSGAAAPAARTTTAGDGSFRVQGLLPGRYRLRILSIGFTPRDLQWVTIDSSSASVDVGTVSLTAT